MNEVPFKILIRVHTIFWGEKSWKIIRENKIWKIGARLKIEKKKWKSCEKSRTKKKVLLNSRKCDIFLSNVFNVARLRVIFFAVPLFCLCPIFHAWDDKIKFYVNVFIWQQILKIIVASAIWRLAALLSSIFMEALLWSGILVDDDSQSSHFWKVSYQWITEYLALRVLCMQLNSRLRYSLLFN